MSIIEKPIEGSEKAGNSLKISARHTIIDWNRQTILHNYDVELVDADGDLLKVEGSGNVLLEGEVFDQWINQAMKDATLSSLIEQYESAQKEQSEVD